MSRKFRLVALSVVGLGAMGGIAWTLQASHAQSQAAPVAKVLSNSIPGDQQPPSANTSWATPPHPPGFASTVDPLMERKKSENYHQLMNLLLPSAKAGSAPAQYELASALNYCDENIHAHFISRSTGVPKTPIEIHEITEKVDENARKQINDSYQRCHDFLNDLSALNSSKEWLDQAVKAGYPPAVFMQAGLMLQASVVKGDSAEIEQARQLAINVVSGSTDSAILFGMADFVAGTGKSQEQTAQLMSAWWLLGCESGYDCGPQSTWILANCIDAQCANKPTVVEELQRMNGAAFGQVQHLADQIRAAIDSHNSNAIKQYL